MVVKFCSISGLRKTSECCRRHFGIFIDVGEEDDEGLFGITLCHVLAGVAGNFVLEGVGSFAAADCTVWISFSQVVFLVSEFVVCAAMDWKISN